MAITQLYTTATFDSDGEQSIAWPSGMTAGTPAAMLVAPGKDRKPKIQVPATWRLKAAKKDGTKLYVNESPTAAEVASPIPVTGRFVMLRAYPGAAGFGKIGTGESIKVTLDGGAEALFGWKETTDTLTASNKTDPTDVANESWVVKGTARVYNTWFTVLTLAGTARIDTNARYFFSLEVKPWAASIAAPVLVNPAEGGVIDNGGPTTFSWTHPDIKTATYAYVYTRTPGSSTWSTLIGIAFREGSITRTISGTDGAAYEWSVRIRYGYDTPGTFTPLAAAGTFTIGPKPSVASVTVSGSGLTRTVTWSPTITHGSMTFYRMRVTEASETGPENAIYDSRIQTGSATTWDVPAETPWVNGGSYKAWVEFEQDGGQQATPVASAAFTVSWTPPTAPSGLVVNTASRPATITAHGVAGMERLRVSFTADGTGYEAFADITADSMTIDLPLAPYDAAVTYSAQASLTVSGVELWSDAVTQTATVTDPNTYLVSADLLTWIQVHLQAAGNKVDTEGATVSYGIGATRPSVIRTPSAGWASSDPVKLLTETAQEWNELIGWMGENPEMVLRYPPEWSRGQGTVGTPAMSMSRTSPLPDERVVDKQRQLRTVSFSWVQR